MNRFESLPVELIAEILGELDISSLVTVAYLSRRLYAIASDSSLNPWRRPILRNLHNPEHEPYDLSLKHLSVRQVVPRQNWVEILSMARASWILYEATLPNLRDSVWEECFSRRYLPGWRKWKRDGGWKEAFLRVLHRTWHRANSSCTSDETWTSYVVIRRSGAANELESSSRNYNPVTIFDDLKLQSNLDHLETRIRLVVELADVRIIAFGVLNKPRGSTTVNTIARDLLHPPGIERVDQNSSTSIVPQDPAEELLLGERSVDHHTLSINALDQLYRRTTHPLPAISHANYPFYTPSGEDKRWISTSDLEEGGMAWVGALLLTAQIVGPHTKERFTEGPSLQDVDLVLGSGRSQYASFTLADLTALAPWLEIPAKISGPGLGNP